MTVLGLHSEPYGVTGNIGENFLRLLGTPVLSQLQTVIREAVQNVADAAKLGVGPEILIRLRQLNGSEMACLRTRLLANLPDEPGSREGLSRFLASSEPIVLEICDFGTTGLGGPTRADRVPVGTERTDFINFLRNIGTPRDTQHGGGTYGFGKSALYAVSRCSTILVDTETDAAGVAERRLIGCHIGSRFETEEEGMLRQFTGRHWWGVIDETDGVADPALDGDAAELAAEIGLPERDGRSGTSVMILDFETEGEDLEVIGQRIVEGMLWSFWPRMMRSVPKMRRFTCRVMVGDKELEVPAPENFPPLDLYCKAMKAARSGEGNDVRTIACQRPIKTLGILALEKGMRGRRKSTVPDGSLFPHTAHHVAVMRPVELVVRYIEGNPIPDERFEWAGVFLANNDDEVERAFAVSEPPAHDDWVPGNMERGHAKTFVKVAMRDIEAAAREMGAVGSAKLTGTPDAPPLAKVAGRLGAALGSVGGDGAGERRGGSGGGGGRGGGSRGARASRPVFERLIREDGVTCAIFVTTVQQDQARTGRAIVAQAAVALDGSATRVDATLVEPEVANIRAVDGSLRGDGAMLALDGSEGQFEIRVRVPPDCAVTLDLRLLLEDAA